MQRASGVLMHVSSLPSKYGIGTFGKEAYQFVDFLSKSGFKYWQVLPLNPTSYGDSPYQSFSTFAGNPYFIDFEILIKEGLLKEEDLIDYEYEDGKYVNYEKIYFQRYKVLKKSFDRSKEILSNELQNFKNENKYWLDDYSFFMALKNYFNGNSFLLWDEDIKTRKKTALTKYKKMLSEEIEFYSYIQYIFSRQWNILKSYANSKKVKIIGDMPIYVSIDSADCWSKKRYFMLDKKYNPTYVAGVPPDYFSSTGQYWGNPLYNYIEMKKSNYEWWINRFKHFQKNFDVVRIDHFRAFESFWQINAKESTAINGKWKKGPGVEIFNILKENNISLEIIAEDLGIITNKVKKLIKETGFPGMKVLQFAFDDYNKNNPYLLKNHVPNSIVYIGTHDNATLKEYLKTVDYKKENYIRSNFRIKEKNLSELFIKGLFYSKSNLAIITIQDMLELEEESRMNIPSTLGGINWCFRLESFEKLFLLEKKFVKYNKKYKR